MQWWMPFVFLYMWLKVYLPSLVFPTLLFFHLSFSFFRGVGSTGVQGSCQKSFECLQFNSQSTAFGIYTRPGPQSLSCAASWTMICRGREDNKELTQSENSVWTGLCSQGITQICTAYLILHNTVQCEWSSRACFHSFPLKRTDHWITSCTCSTGLHWNILCKTQYSETIVSDLVFMIHFTCSILCIVKLL